MSKRLCKGKVQEKPVNVFLLTFKTVPPLLPNTKIPENILQHLITRYHPCDLTQMVQTFPDVLRQKLAGLVVVEAILNTKNGCVSH